MQASRSVDPLDAEAADRERERRRRVGNLKRKAAALRRHRAARDPLTGKSLLAEKAGRAGWRKRAEAHPGGARGLGLELALARWHRDGQGNGDLPEPPEGQA